MKSSYFIPLEVKKDVIGILHLVSIDKGININEADNIYLNSFINQITFAINNSLLFERLTKAMRDLERMHIKLKEKTDLLTEDLKLARKIQQAVLPTKLNELKNIRFFLQYIPLQHVGGDFYDIFKLHEDKIRIFLCDATGHGVQGALTTMAIKALYESFKLTIEDPSDLLALINDEYSEKLPIGSYFTAVIMDVDCSCGTISYSNAGHPYPILISNHSSIQLEGRSRMIGISFGDSEYKTYNISVTDGSKVYLFTDGIFEAFNVRGEEYGEKRILKFLSENRFMDLRELGKALMYDVHKFLDRKNLTDDLCLIGFELPNLRKKSISGEEHEPTDELELL